MECVVKGFRPSAAATVLMLIAVAGFSRAALTTHCGDAVAPNHVLSPEFEIVPSKDDVRGRYLATHCVNATLLPAKWKFDMSTLSKPQKDCSADSRFNNIGSHSLFDESLNNTYPNCSFVCYTKILDLMYSECYMLQNNIQKPKVDKNNITHPDTLVTIHHNVKYYYADSNITSENFSKHRNMEIHCTESGNATVCDWVKGWIPITEYTVKYWANNSEKVIATEHCKLGTGPEGGLHCELPLGPGNYTIQLEHTAPWSFGHGSFAVFQYNYNNMPETDSKVPVATPNVALVGLGGAVAVFVAVVVAATVYTHRAQIKQKMKNLRAWVMASKQCEQIPPARDGEVLVLYTRECGAVEDVGRQLVAALQAAALQAAAPGKILDLYSESVRQSAAASPHAWLREKLERGCRLVLIQTPGLKVLFDEKMAVDNTRPESPLLGVRVLYRRPQYADEMMRYAVRLLREGAAIGENRYVQFYLATVRGLPVEANRYLVPFTRFYLPEHLTVLSEALFRPTAVTISHDDSVPTPEDVTEVVSLHHKQALREACDNLVKYAVENPNYLVDNLMVIEQI